MDDLFSSALLIAVGLMLFVLAILMVITGVSLVMLLVQMAWNYGCWE